MSLLEAKLIYMIKMISQNFIVKKSITRLYGFVETHTDYKF